MIAISVLEKDIEGILGRTAACKESADIMEIRVDPFPPGLSIPFDALIEAASPTPVIITNRRREEGGSFNGDEVSRIARLKEALRHRPAYIDVELSTEPQLRDGLLSMAKEAGVKTIVSWHDFEATPARETICSIFEQMASLGADVAKIVTTARSHRDFLTLVPLFSLAQGHKTDVIAFCMGSAGIYSRVCAPFMGSMLTFAAPDQAQATAPGQLAVSRLKEIMETLGFKKEG